MSTSDLYLIFKTKVSHLSTYQNGWGSAPALWEYFSQKYFKQPFSFTDTQLQNNVWNLVDNPSIPYGERLCMFLTLDKSIITKSKWEETGSAAIDIHKKIIKETHWTWSHWESIGQNLILLSKSKTDHRLVGIGLSCTSINDPFDSYNYNEIKTESTLQQTRSNL